uniref:Histone H2B n=1 Tax=Tanacetum cinerariifolium TaxID=118510 RepID=A0A6L2LGQ3_TANCI|nr:histone H2B [Tanacetum cinerariifolium]
MEPKAAEKKLMAEKKRAAEKTPKPKAEKKLPTKDTPVSAEKKKKRHKKEIQTAVRLVLLGELAKHAVSEDIFAFIHTPDPTKVRVVKRERDEGEPRLLDSTIGRTIPLLLVALKRDDSELEASVDRLFDESVVEAADTFVENVAHVWSRRQRKRKFVIADASVVSHPPKKIREDHGTSSGAFIYGKSQSMLQRLLVRAAKVEVAAIPTLPFVTTYVSTTPERKDGDHTDFVAEPNLFMTIVTTVTSTVDPTLVTKEKLTKPFLFGAGSSSAGGTDPITSVFLNLTGSDFLVDAIRTVIFSKFTAARQMSLSAEEAKAAKAICLRAKASNFETMEKSLRDEMNALMERNIILENERNALDVKRITVYENCMDQLEKFQDDQMKVVNDKFDRLWLLTYGMELAIVNCLNSPEYLFALGAAIAKAIEKEVNYISALQQLQNVNFSLLAKLKSNKYASVETVMDILHLEGPLVEKMGLNKLQPHVDQLMVPIHSSRDKVVVGATVVSLPLDVSSGRVQKIRKNLANQRSALHDVFLPLAEPFSASVLTGTEDDYEVMGANDQAVVDENVASFPNVDDVELNIR